MYIVCIQAILGGGPCQKAHLPTLAVPAGYGLSRSPATTHSCALLRNPRRSGDQLRYFRYTFVFGCELDVTATRPITRGLNGCDLERSSQNQTSHVLRPQQLNATLGEQCTSAILIPNPEHSPIEAMNGLVGSARGT
jgi:hypothetical protein